MEIQDLYRDVILDHNRSPRNFGRLEPADASAVGHNPLCGDALSVTLRLEGDQLSDLRFNGQGCAISIASASLMGEVVRGKSLTEIDTLYREVHSLLTEPGYSPAIPLGKLMALSGVREYPARVKCASLCWHTLQAALHRPSGEDSPAPVSTENP
jgi:nitrogen fixation NifU-like protein